MNWHTQAFSIHAQWSYLAEAIAQIAVLVFIMLALAAVCIFLG